MDVPVTPPGVKLDKIRAFLEFVYLEMNADGFHIAKTIRRDSKGQNKMHIGVCAPGEGYDHFTFDQIMKDACARGALLDYTHAIHDDAQEQYADDAAR